MAEAQNCTVNTELGARKLLIEIRLLELQARWETVKNVCGILIPIVTLMAAVAGGVTYFRDEAQKQSLHREEVFTLGARDLGNPDEFVRFGAVTNLTAYASQDKRLAEKVVRLICYRAVEESPMVDATIRSALVELQQQFNTSFEMRSIFPQFRDELHKDLNAVKARLDSLPPGEKAHWEQKRKTLEAVLQFLSEEIGVR